MRFLPTQHPQKGGVVDPTLQTQPSSPSHSWKILYTKITNFKTVRKTLSTLKNARSIPCCIHKLMSYTLHMFLGNGRPCAKMDRVATESTMVVQAHRQDTENVLDFNRVRESVG